MSIQNANLPHVFVVHLSDIHIHHSQPNVVVARTEQIAAAIRAIEPGVDRQCVLLVTGDIAFSGRPKEYEIAYDFLTGLLKKLELDTNHSVSIVLIPGNHDCNFERDKQTRIRIRSTLLQDDKQVEDSVVDAMTEVQSDYFEFVSKLRGVPSPQGLDRLFQTYEICVAGKTLYVNAYNTSWMSVLKEKTGECFLPVPMLKANSPDGVVFSIFHHPYNWFEPGNAREFRKLIEHSSDFVLTGHEHVDDSRYVIDRDGFKQQYLDGAVLQESGYPDVSGFQVVILDLSKSCFRLAELKWDKERYCSTLRDWLPISLRSFRRQREFRFKDDFEKELNSCEFDFSSREKQFLLGDLFVYPDLLVSSPRDQSKPMDLKSGKFDKKRIRSGETLGFIRSHSKIIIYGPEKSGKTALRKRLQMEMYDAGLLPVNLDLRLLGVREITSVDKTVEKAFVEQYDGSLESYWQTPLEQRVYLVDNFHWEVGLDSQKQLLLETLTAMGGCVILFSGNDLIIDELAVASGMRSLNDFIHCEISQFGYGLRSQLIERWYSAADPYASDGGALRDKCIEVEKFVDKMIRAQLVTPYPVIVLIILQQIETNLGHDITSASYSAFCEVYVKYLLSRMSERTGIELGTFEVLLQELAYCLYEAGDRSMSSKDLEKLIDRYRVSKLIKVETKSLIDALKDRGFLRHTHFGYEFMHNYQFYYFTAAYINHLLTVDTRKGVKVVEHLVKHLHLENNANVVVMLGHLSKDPRIIMEVLQEARTLLKSQPVCDFDRSTQFVARLLDQVPKLVFEYIDPAKFHSKRLEILDARAEGDKDAQLPADYLAERDPSHYEESVDEANNAMHNLVVLNRVFKTIDVMGQMLRSYAGSLDGELKVEVMRECYDLTMRSIGFLYSFIEANVDHLVQFVSQVFSETVPSWKHLDKKELQQRSKSFIFNLCIALAHAALQRLTNAVGALKLELVFDKLVSEAPLSYRLIDYSIRTVALNHFDVTEIKRLNQLTRNNYFASVLFKRLTLSYFRVYRVRYSVIQQTCAVLDINVGVAQLRDFQGGD